MQKVWYGTCFFEIPVNHKMRYLEKRVLVVNCKFLYCYFASDNYNDEYSSDYSVVRKKIHNIKRKHLATFNTLLPKTSSVRFICRYFS